ncbi:hypothetical protein BHM03_00007143 [Ensete ventricosum]|uniref:mannan endo-1,4-beta-mannosidase n=1 Tax=Ensete ventricosum TaxID=4639 RepID=A0A445MBX5_ENSVE|nr:hypothetical protein BHM03_00007143 [Ensete ventricosum]
MMAGVGAGTNAASVRSVLIALAWTAALSRCGAHAMSGMEDEAWGAVERRGTHFVVRGRPFLVHGFNTYWLMVFAADPATRCKVSDVFKDAADAGLTVCRTWAFNDGGWRALQISPFVYDEEVFKGLDFVVNEARTHGMRLMLSLCNNWEDYGGKAQYVRWGKEAGLDLSGDDDFFSDPTVKGYYKAFVKVKHKAWFEEMAAYVKSIDPMHLLEIGVEDPDSDAHLQFVRDWMHQHMDDAEKLLGMPVVFGEFGASVKDERFDSGFRETFMETVYNTLLSSRTRRDVGGGCLVWQLFPEGTEHMDDGYAVVLAESPSTLQMLSQHSRNLQTHHSKGSCGSSEPREEL